MSIVHCKFCNAEIDKNTAFNPLPRMYFCSKAHYDERERQRLGENGKGNKIKYKPQEGTARRDFTNKVQSIYVDRYGWDKRKINWTMICSQASNLLKEHEVWSYETLTYILYYMNDVLGLDLICAESNYNPLSLLPFYAQQAEDYYNECVAIEDYIDKFNFNEDPIVITKNNGNIKHKIKEIDISKL